ncbi:DUF6907 domain-containing protein [Streptomyces sp. NPDC058066]|uniref:DUF6907 domain-containing protein n=1 Tax=Streptomyces sp. NPDC058066 TaxID=3346323 RepID=UPI0036E371D5
MNGRQIFIECPSWCVTDHVAANERHLEDIEHAGEMTDLVIPGGPGYRLLAHARLGWNPYGDDADRGPYVVVDDASEPFVVTPAEASVFADWLEAFAAQLRHLAVAALTAPLETAQA